jgi:uncharacterized UPF0160 family protein
MNPDFLVTHSGGFHADEVLSSVILIRLFPQARVIRSRAPEWIKPGADRIIYDVGGAYDAELRIFDHHQRGAPLREDGQPYSSFGLVWKQYGRDYLVATGIPEAHVEALHASFDLAFVLPIDLTDNGALSPSGALAGLTLSALLETLKWPSPAVSSRRRSAKALPNCGPRRSSFRPSSVRDGGASSSFRRECLSVPRS